MLNLRIDIFKYSNYFWDIETYDIFFDSEVFLG